MSIEASAISILDSPSGAKAGARDERGTLASDESVREVGWVEGVLSNLGVWLLYTPHFAILRALGPRYGLHWARVVARAHWLLTFIGVQKTTRENLLRLRQYFRTDASVASMLRRHLEMKHECFARVRVYHQHGPAAGGMRWKISPCSKEKLEAARSSKGGLLAVGFHYNFFEMTAPAFEQLLPERQPVQLKLRQSHNLEQATSFVAKVAIRRSIDADRRSGARVLYIDDEKSIRPIIRKLREGGAVGIAADGTYSSDFIDAPFFDGTLRVPTGWARLAGMTGARVLFGVDRPGEDPSTREMKLFDELQCENVSEDTIRRAVEGAVKLLEEAIMSEPWSWHPWQRLKSITDRSGVKRYTLTRLSDDKTGLHSRKRRLAAESTPTARTTKPRVAVLCNSVTPYRLHLHRRIVQEVPEAELWTLMTHGNAYNRWSGCETPEEIRPVVFGKGEPTNEQTMLRFTAREWRKGGQVIKWLKKNQIDAVFCQGCGDTGRLRVLRWCHKNKIPVFLTGDFNRCGIEIPWWKRIVKRLVYRSAVSWSDGLAPCGQLGLVLLRGYGGIDKPSYRFPFLPDTSLQSNPPASAVERTRERFGFDPERRRIVFSARLMEVKRPDLAIRAFAQIARQRPEWDLVMLGDGDLRKTSEELVPEQLRPRVFWTGFFDRPEDVAAMYRLSDVLLLPSDHEPWGVVIVEAAAAGLAIVATDVVGAAPELVHSGRNGETFPSGDVDSLRETLLRVTSSDRIDAMKNESPRVLEEWLRYADPVINFRASLQDFGLIAKNKPSQIGQEIPAAEVTEKSLV